MADTNDTQTPEGSAGSLVSFTAQLVAGYAASHRTSTAELARLIGIVHASLASIATGPTNAGEGTRVVPAVPVRSSIKRDALICLVCGRKMRMLRRHIGAAHGLSPVEYREAFELREDYPMVAGDVVIGRRKATPIADEADTTSDDIRSNENGGSPSGSEPPDATQSFVPKRRRLTLAIGG